MEDADSLRHALQSRAFGTVGTLHSLCIKEGPHRKSSGTGTCWNRRAKRFEWHCRHVEYDFSETMRPAITAILDDLEKLGEFHLTHVSKDVGNSDLSTSGSI